MYFFSRIIIIMIRVRNSTQTAVTNMTIKRMLENKIVELEVSYV